MADDETDLLVPLKMLRSGEKSGDYDENLQLAVVSDTDTAIVVASPFKIPDDWGVEEVARADSSRTDKYYYEPGTGNKFRSLKEVERYMKGGEYTPTRRSSRQHKPVRPFQASQTPASGKMVKSGGNSYSEPGTGNKFRSLREVERNTKGGEYTSRRRSLRPHKPVQPFQASQNPASRKMVMSGGNVLMLDKEDTNEYQLAVVTPESGGTGSQFKLPDGWIVEEVPRKRRGPIDRYYYEPGTGQKFRSLVAVKRYLEELEENKPLSVALMELKENTPLSKAFKLPRHVKNSASASASASASPKKNVSSEKVRSSTFVEPPQKINWVLASPGGDSWNPFISDVLIPDSVKQQWSTRFLSSMNDGNDNKPILIGQSDGK